MYFPGLRTVCVVVWAMHAFTYINSRLGARINCSSLGCVAYLLPACLACHKICPFLLFDFILLVRTRLCPVVLQAMHKGHIIYIVAFLTHSCRRTYSTAWKEGRTYVCACIYSSIIYPCPICVCTYVLYLRRDTSIFYLFLWIFHSYSYFIPTFTF